MTSAVDSKDHKKLANDIRASEGVGPPVDTVLKTSQRVIARVTDGIYRQPGSAIRELISNAYDADASRVVVKTSPPRFDRIAVEDDGRGMSPEVLAYLLENIGGSAKRRQEGAGLGMTSEADTSLSPRGRQLIGKIGIGLFSVSQLTNSFQIITKTKGDAFRTVATVVMRQYSDAMSAESASDDLDAEFESGKVRIWREPAVDTENHGTTIVLNRIRRQARDTLRSSDIWSLVEQNEQAHPEDRQAIEPPKFHAGRVDAAGELLRLDESGRTSFLPWDDSDSPSRAFEKLVDCVWDEVGAGNPNPKLEEIFDYYLRMVWQISLAIPLPYVAGHLFEQPGGGWARIYKLSNSPKGIASEITDESAGAIRELADLSTPLLPPGDFSVLFDSLELKHPIKYRDLPVTNNAVKFPLVFLGKVEERFGGVPFELSGGPLSFEAYLFWSPKIAPVEHQGALVRIHGASGTLFDPGFMRYQVQEIQRLKQITCEIYVSEGLDSALNIDRESFNNAHPHAVYLTKWLHSALRQLATAQKRVGAGLRSESRGERQQQTFSAIQSVADRVWSEEVGDDGSLPPDVVWSSEVKGHTPASYVFEKDVVAPRGGGATAAVRETSANLVLEKKLKAIAQVLATFGLLDNLSMHKQQSLLAAIFEIMNSTGES